MSDRHHRTDPKERRDRALDWMLEESHDSSLGAAEAEEFPRFDEEKDARVASLGRRPLSHLPGFLVAVQKRFIDAKRLASQRTSL